MDADDMRYLLTSKKARYEDEDAAGYPDKRVKACGKFFSTAGCQFGDACRYIHYVPGGYAHRPTAYSSSYSQHQSHPYTASRPPPRGDFGHRAPMKTKLCNNFYTAEGCRFRDRCHYAHGEAELVRPSESSSVADYPSSRGGYSQGGYASAGGYSEQPLPDFADEPLPPGVVINGANLFTIPATMVGAVIGKGGIHTKYVYRSTGAKVAVKDIDGDPDNKHVFVTGSPSETDAAMELVKRFILNRSATATSIGKTRICERFMQGSCSFGDNCHYAHGAGELRDPAVK